MLQRFNKVIPQDDQQAQKVPSEPEEHLIEKAPGNTFHINCREFEAPKIVIEDQVTPIPQSTKTQATENPTWSLIDNEYWAQQMVVESVSEMSVPHSSTSNLKQENSKQAHILEELKDTMVKI